jgi:cellulose biosynthesis protein BcsQ
MSVSVITIANTAGGSGKTTLAHALSVAFIEYGKKVLLIDLDPRAFLTFRVGRENSRWCISDYLRGSIKLEDPDSHSERFDFISSDSRSGFGYSETELRSLIDSFPKDYDLIIIDTPSDVNAGLVAALRVADLLLIPYSQSVHHYRGIEQIQKLAPDTKKLLLRIGDETDVANQFNQWDHLDGRCSRALEITQAELTAESVLTTAKNSQISREIRESAYSVLEEIGLA